MRSIPEQQGLDKESAHRLEVRVEQSIPIRGKTHVLSQKCETDKWQTLDRMGTEGDD